jgi:hypothetical protein
MGKSISVTKKSKRGRPATTGTGVQIGERWQPSEIAAIDDWIAGSGEKMTRGQAVRQLVTIGLSASVINPVSQKKANDSAAKAAQLARELGLITKK